MAKHRWTFPLDKVYVVSVSYPGLQSRVIYELLSSPSLLLCEWGEMETSNKSDSQHCPHFAKQYWAQQSGRSVSKIVEMKASTLHLVPLIRIPLKVSWFWRCLFGAFNFLQKANKNMSTWGLTQFLPPWHFLTVFRREKIPGESRSQVGESV